MMHKIGERISGFRKERNMSQEELAAVLNVSRQTVSKWETGDTLPDVYNAVAIARLFHVSLDQLVLGTAVKGGESTYMAELKQKRQTTNIKAIIVGSIGSLTFALSLVLLDTFQPPAQTQGITMAFVFPVLMVCWAYAIYNLVKVGRYQQEIKYLQSIELHNITNAK
ncbi:helix-turn-helix transcriptional regulator [Candidatus Xianfuyuplasma coldseepsis]|uniref:Helix-turn-helix transcriptional regulator n=1 Tax=Candidatus Xianfuyuplasma coldseepsis TaxID=2782163 RepID=A0A7L7KNJ5_9MOLU|nr:helix-turn-helix transcriptional regulator [Xianfuyuplasma coldseepsis]QMS84233.1 helix-turn-helix transcriptional regulator [Xianfuyuplasma coldseepsis]